MVALASGATHGALQTFSMGFAEEHYSELVFARQIADRFGTQHTEEIVTPDAVSLIDELTHFYDEPFADSSAIPTYLVARLASRSVKVVLSGDGGDEAFGGYAVRPRPEGIGGPALVAGVVPASNARPSCPRLAQGRLAPPAAPCQDDSLEPGPRCRSGLRQHDDALSPTAARRLMAPAFAAASSDTSLSSSSGRATRRRLRTTPWPG